jgi:hypothetical protein
MVNLPNTTPIALMNYFCAKSSQANSKLQTTLAPASLAKALCRRQSQTYNQAVSP